MDSKSNDDRGGHSYYSALVERGNRLNLASRRLAGDGSVIEALACQVGSDLAVVQAVMWEQLIMLSSNATAQLLAQATPIFQSVFDSLDRFSSETVPAGSLLIRLRTEVVKAVQPGQARELESRFAELDHFDAAHTVTEIELQEWRNQRVGGLAVEEYVKLRRAEAVARMGHAQEHRVSGSTTSAISAAYESDMLALDAYLIESAMACGDVHFFTVVVRWELAVESVSALQGVPEGFHSAVTAIREVILSVLDGGDKQRMNVRFPELS
jgi:hypothetical protein